MRSLYLAGLIGAVGIAGYALYRAQKKAVTQATANIVGKSGKVWMLESAALPDNATATTVYATPGSFGTNMFTPVLQYHQQGTDTFTRTAMWKTSDQALITAGALATAADDFAVKLN